MVSHACSPCMISFYEYSIEEKWLLCTHGPVSIFADSVSDSLQVCNKTCGTCLKSVSSMKMPSLWLQTFTPLNLSTVESTELLSLIMSNANIYLHTKLIAWIFFLSFLVTWRWAKEYNSLFLALWDTSFSPSSEKQSSSNDLWRIILSYTRHKLVP